MNFEQVIEVLHSKIANVGYFTDDEDLKDKEYNISIFGNTSVTLYHFEKNKISEKFLYQLSLDENSSAIEVDIEISDYFHSFLRKNNFSDLVTPMLDPSIPVKKRRICLAC